MAHPSLTVGDIARFLAELAPPGLSEPWDNTGLLVGDENSPARNVLTCLTLTEDVAEEAAHAGVGLVVSHHPLLFKAVKRITAESSEGRTLLTLLKAGIAVYSPHTAFDSAAQGINRRLASKFGLSDIRPLRPTGDESPAGGGRFGRLPEAVPLSEFLQVVRRSLGVDALGYVGQLDRSVRMVAVACGAAAEFLDDALHHDCDVLVTGEARFHACLDARAKGVAMILAGHYATERPAVEELAQLIAATFPGLVAAASRVESDPLKWSTP
ncbi:GTP cyclohydrolase 1 type 2 [Caulifigura coniformis]|uniref:GTP cyclohydrolase 1 type 2 homolog n=1 Tax=Caulifigura coniformis TaxID=2527983 RepID=A0A517SIY5_9PLAN|nr:Nif3-like dinuclear metal center hexameric protein [Caulifigura coniformis]QDT56104.1 GTP cyclohydrolase 1 type 2 [Caulifigura coniformis]